MEGLSPLHLPLPWRRVGTVSVGGLTAVGFSDDSRHLLVESHSGLGVLELSSARRVARSEVEPTDDSLTRNGIGPIDGQLIQMAGLWGGQLDFRSADGWSFRELPSDEPEFPPDGIEVVSPEGGVFPLRNDVSEFRVAGFAKDGLVLVFGTSADLTIFTRPNAGRGA